jgi:hypothetical protein
MDEKSKFPLEINYAYGMKTDTCRCGGDQIEPLPKAELALR